MGTRSRSHRATWLARVGLGAVAIAAAAPAAAGDIQPIATSVSPLYGRINPFYGDVDAAYGRINPFYGRINPFYGRINPFWGDVSGFWGRINPFTQTTDAFYGTNDSFWGSANPYKGTKNGISYGAIAGFWSGEVASWNMISAQWSAATTLADATAVATALQASLFAPADKFWGSALPKAATGSTATATLMASTLAAAGIGQNDDGTIKASTLLDVDPSTRAMLFINLYDNLMDYAGTGHIDWWMGSVGWSPALAEVQGMKPSGGSTPTIGMIDFVIASGKNVSKQVTQYGSSVFADGHGAAVGSLIIGATDGSGVLGVMPQGSGNVVVYNPYDDTGTTNWADVGTGVQTLSNMIFKGKTVPMGVLNASLGVPGWTLNPGWNDALAYAGAYGHDLVVAAGNDGVTQTVNVPWNFDRNPTLLIVGSVGVDGTISNFSNRPGEACLLPTGTSVCTEANKLKYRFIVAPGELILVSDGLGGHVRQSGTSLAAPLVSGAIGLLQNRWPWLAYYPDETAAIILQSATPKGTNPGADPVYGVGELNIAASQSPLNWNNLFYYQQSKTSLGIIPISLSTVINQIGSGTQSAWDAAGLSYSAIERIGNTLRDFQIPLSSKLVGQNVSTLAGGQQYQSFLTAALRAQAGRFAGIAPIDNSQGVFTSGFERSTVPVGRIGDVTLRVNVAQAELGSAFQTRTPRYETDAMLVSDRGSVQFGFGNGAASLDGSASFAYRTDYDLSRGGANPLLGLASGGAYLGARATLLPGLTVGIGTTDRLQRRNLAALGIPRQTIGSWVDRYAAQAQHVSVAYAVSPRLALRAAMTFLHEDSALLGIQSLDPGDLRKGSTSNGMTAGFDLAVARTLTFSASGTLARSKAAAGQITTRDLTSGSAQLAITKSRLLGRSDEVRLSLASPLHTIGGRLSYTSIGVVDRDTGALGVMTQSFSPRGGRLPLAGEALYGVSLPRGRGEFSLFGRIDRDSDLAATRTTGYAAGAQVRLAL